VLVPRTRFAPVKTTEDLLALRSDAYRTTEDNRIELLPERGGEPPDILLDTSYYKLLGGFEAGFGSGVPSLARCAKLEVRGPWTFDAGVTCEGTVIFENSGTETARVPAGVYRDTKVIG